jgi:hypothetical protein
MMVEVFKTDVKDRDHADMLVDEIHKTFCDYTANFDLDDCDRILRVKSTAGNIQASSLIGLLNDCGFHAEVLPDDSPDGGNRTVDIGDWGYPNTKLTVDKGS